MVGKGGEIGTEIGEKLLTWLRLGVACGAEMVPLVEVHRVRTGA